MVAYQDETVGPAMLATTWTLLFCCFVVIGLRWYHRLLVLRARLQSFDYVMALAFLCELGSAIIRTKAVQIGYGHHISALNSSQLAHIGKIMFFNQVPAVFSSCFGRVAFALYLIEIVGPTSRWQRRLLQFTIVQQLIFSTLTETQVVFRCGGHIAAAYGTPDPAAHCQAAKVQTVIGYILSGFNSISDIILTIVPLHIIKQLKMSTRVKVGLAGVLCLSLLALVASLVKLYQVRVLEMTSDFTWTLPLLNLCGTVENDMVMLGATIPLLKPVFMRPGGGSSYGNRTAYAVSKIGVSTNIRITEEARDEKKGDEPTAVVVQVDRELA